MKRLPGAIFQQENARPHTARVSQDCLRTVTTFPWPARSPDFSPIEHIWVKFLLKHYIDLNRELDQLECRPGRLTIFQNYEM
ncbi:transposable element Tcb2 transposase [Trichonephila clavipes]|nr:transposable element Tcb2 transposase [Trichonephila clavipes]